MAFLLQSYWNSHNQSQATAAAVPTNKEASLATRHDSGEYCGAVVWVRVSGQEAKDGRASACADAWRADKTKQLSFIIIHL